MKWFMNDKDGITQKEYLLLYTTVIYAAVVIPIMVCVLANPKDYSEYVLTFLLDLSHTVSIAYGSVISFYFLTKGSFNIVQLFSSKNIKQNIQEVEKQIEQVKDNTKESVQQINNQK